MRIGLIADIHSNLEALESVLEKLKECDEILCAGDLVGYGADPNKVIELIKENKIKSVKGNHDAAILDEMSLNWFNRFAQAAILWTKESIEEENKLYLKNLPLELTKIYDGIKILIMHGGLKDRLREYIHYPSDLNEYKQKTKADLMIVGHTHIPGVWQLNSKVREIKTKMIRLDRFTLLNPGAVGQSRNGRPEAYYAILDTDAKVLFVKSTSYDIEKAANKIIEAGLPEWLGKRLFMGM